MSPPSPTAAAPPTTSPEKLIIGTAAVCLGLLLIASLVWFFGWDNSNPDVTAYWRAGVNLRQGNPVYGPAPPGVSPKAFIYPPAFAVLFAPLTTLPTLWGYATWMVLHGVFLAWLVWAAARLAGLGTRTAQCRYLALLLLWLPAAVGGDFQEGQVNLLVAAMVATALLLIDERRPWSGGLMLALATHIKLLPLVLLLPLLIQGRRQAVAAAVAGTIALGLLPAVLTIPLEGWSAGLWRAVSLHVDFWQSVVAPALSDAEVAGAQQFYVLNNSLTAVLHRLFGTAVAFSPLPALASWRGPLLFGIASSLLRATALSAGLMLYVSALVLAHRTAHRRGGRVAALGLAYIAAQLTAPTYWEHHLVFLAIVLAPWADIEIVDTRIRSALAALCATVLACWSGPYLLDPFARLFESNTIAVILSASRTWGFPTAAVLTLFALSLVAHFDAERERLAPKDPASGRSALAQGTRTEA